MNKKLEKLEEQITLIKDNHLVHLGEAMSEMRVEIMEIKTDVGWLKDNHRVVRNAVYASLVSGVVGAVISILK